MSGQIEYIRTFLEVVRQGGFAPASRALGLSPTIVTRHVSELEAQLGVQLFTRTTRKVDLTDAGRLYCDRVAPVVADLDDANEAARSRQVGLSGPLKVSAPMSFGHRHLPAIIAQFRTLHPAVQVNLQLTDRFVDVAREGFDMALRVSAPPQDQKTIWQKICPIERVLVAAPNYLARHRSLEQPEDLSRHQCLHYAFGPERPVWQFTIDDRQTTVPINPCLISNSGDLIAKACVLSEGIALLPRFIVKEHLDSGSLRTVLPDAKPPEIWLAAAFPPYERLPAKVAAFTSFVQSALGPDTETHVS